MISNFWRLMGILFLSFLLLTMFAQQSFAATQCQKKVDITEDIESVEKNIIEAEKVVIRVMQEKQEIRLVVEAQNKLDDLIKEKIALESALKWSASRLISVAKESLALGVVSVLGIGTGAFLRDISSMPFPVPGWTMAPESWLDKLLENKRLLKFGLALSVIRLLVYLASSNKITKFEEALAKALKKKQALREEKLIDKINILDEEIKKIQEKLDAARFTQKRNAALVLKAEAERKLEKVLEVPDSISSLTLSALSREEIKEKQREVIKKWNERIAQAQKELDKAVDETRKFLTEEEFRRQQMAVDWRIEYARQRLAR